MSNTFGSEMKNGFRAVNSESVAQQKKQLDWINNHLKGESFIPGKYFVHAEQESGNSGDGNIPLTILYGTHTGHSEDIAYRIFDLAEASGFEAEIFLMEEYNYPEVANAKNVLMILPTHGEGDPPVNSVDMLAYLRSDECPSLTDVNYAVLALGDKIYKSFCKAGVDFDEVMKERGANNILPIVKCDVDYEEDASNWITTVLQVVREVNGGAGNEPMAGAAESNGSKDTSYSRKDPYFARVKRKVRLTGEDSLKDVYHVELDIADSGFTYEPGDNVGVFGNNPVELVEGILDYTGINGQTEVALNDWSLPLETALRNRLEINILTSHILASYYELTNIEALGNLLVDEEKLDEYLYGHDALDMLMDFPAKITASQLVSVLPELSPRLYSIASSQKVYPDEVHITVVAVRYRNRDRDRKGTCSTFLTDRIEEGSWIPVFIDHNLGFKMPEELDAPMIMVGAGTGVAPYRSFIQQRNGDHVNGESWLFFGDQHKKSDFLYREDWEKFRQQGVLTELSLAFSRDQEQKVYVQHRMLEMGKELYNWLQKGAYLYVCGDKTHMARDVHETLKTIVAAEGGLEPEKAEDFLKDLKKQKRYQIDVY
ncbi:sulfite reductase flavoprotein subunit alpha [Prolixibacter sp. SD074]|uniref:diflavin oxidoreductase n=1 Tax=Prolixibacter sp. SD074 TaxID=2652391 RepID=UPI00126F68E3|nr:flavodoxin domain-containing protein [Prolixibacter sp. SD074]GET28396.1 sulfite reductase [NADPH] flavoprotein alpha-component [Prolixibacter sp. SD074]